MKISSFKHILLATALLTAPLAAPSALAQNIPAGGYNIPSQPLGDALTQLAQESGRNILFSSTAVNSRTSAAVRGAKDFETALRALTSGANVEYAIRADGSVTIRAANGRPSRRSSGDSASRQPSESETVIIQARRFTEAQEIELKSSTIVNVLSEQEIASHPDRNVAETLARVPGINVMYSTMSQAGSQGNGANYGGLDTAARAEGQFVSVRAMNGEYNVNLINGIDVAQGMPYSREVQLSLLPPVGIENIVVSKTSTADMQGDAIGGTIDFRMPSALSNPGLHFSLYSSGQYEDRAAQYGLDHMGYQVQGSVSDTFGSRDQFGIYVSGYYSDRNFANSEQTYQGGEIEYQLVNAKKQLPAGVSPDSDLQLMTLNMQLARGETARYGAVASVDWNVDSNIHAFFRGTYARSGTNETVYQLGVQGDRTDIGGFAVGVPVDSTAGADGLMRVVSTKNELHYWAESNPSRDVLGTAVLGADVNFGRLSMTPQIYYSWGANDFPNHFEVTFYNRANDPAGDDANPAYQRFNSGFGIGYNGKYPVPIFTAGELSNIAHIGDWKVRNGGEVTDGRSNQRKTGGKLDFSYDVDEGWLDTVKFGMKYSSADRNTSFRDTETDAAIPKGATLSNSGMVDATVDEIIPGVYNFSMPLISASRFWSAYTKNGGFNVTWSPDDYNGNSVKGNEAVAAGYVTANLKFDDVEITPGLRFEHTDVHNIFWIKGNNGVDTGGQHYGWSSSDSSFDEFLPSVFAAWRPDSQSIYRAGVWTSYTRPPFIELAGNTSTSVDGDGNIHITKGNPDLKPIKAVNFDASGAWTTDFDSYASVAVFYKAISNFIYNGGGNFSTVSTQTGARTTVSQPINGGDGHVYGVELNLRQNFSMLPGLFGGFGVAANATFQSSEVNLNNPYLDSSERMQNAPSTLLNLSLLYEKYGFSGDLSYHLVFGTPGACADYADVQRQGR